MIYPKKTTLASRLHFPPLPPLADGQTEEEDEEDEVGDDTDVQRPIRRRQRQRLHQTQEEHLFLDFVRTLLWLDPVTRCTANEAMRHKWFDSIEEIEAYDFDARVDDDEDDDDDDDDEEGEEDWEDEEDGDEEEWEDEDEEH